MSKKKKGNKSLREEIMEIKKRFYEAVEILESTSNCRHDDIDCMMDRVIAYNELNELIDRVFVFRSAFVASGSNDAAVLKFYEDFILALKNAVEKYGVIIDESKWARALAATSRYRDKLDGVRLSDVRKEGDAKYI